MCTMFQPIKKKKVDASTFCGFCLGTADCNKDGEEEELISCADCGNSGGSDYYVLKRPLFDKTKKTITIMQDDTQETKSVVKIC